MKKLHPLRRAYIELLLANRDAQAMIIRLNAVKKWAEKRVS